MRSGGQSYPADVEFQAAERCLLRADSYSWIRILTGDVAQAGDNGLGARGACTGLTPLGGPARFPALTCLRKRRADNSWRWDVSLRRRRTPFPDPGTNTCRSSGKSL